MSTIRDCLDFCHQHLDHTLPDYAPNGLQVEGKVDIAHLVSGVTASQAFIEAAIEAGADAVIVHHGLFWKKMSPCLTGFQYQRIKHLMQANMNLLAYHLPLDVHPVWGNNAQMAKALSLKVIQQQDTMGVPQLLWLGEAAYPETPAQWGDKLTEKYQKPLWIEGRSSSIKRLAWCSGSAAEGIFEAAKWGVDAYVTGEINEAAVHWARELGIHLFAAGHHATERDGVRAFGDAMAKALNIKHTFIDIPNPV